MARVAHRILVSGVVQGVGYRRWVERAATEMGVSGWVRNLYDGRVEIFAEAEELVVLGLAEQCREGPRYATVESVEVRGAKKEGGSRFEVRRDAAAPEED